MKYSIIVGSHRKPSQSTKVANHIHSRFSKLDISKDVSIINLENNPLPLWNEEWKEHVDNDTVEWWEDVLKTLTQVDGAVIISPEWNGMVPPGLKNFLLTLSTENPKPLAHKPVLITTVSSSRGGAYPISELRSSGYKNNFINYIPQHLIVRNVQDILQDDVADEYKKEDEYLQARIDYSLKLLDAYAKGFEVIRSFEIVHDTEYKNGM